MKKLQEIGEFAFIERIQGFFPSFQSNVLVGIGDDCAVVEGREGHPLLLTCDSQVEGVHFLSSLTPPRRVGRRLVAVNLSDIAAMGGRPVHALLSCVWRGDVEDEWALEFVKGVQEESRRYAVNMVGGNLSQTSHSMVFDLTVVGEIDGSPRLLRRYAVPGHVVMVTGTLGDAAAGLAVLKRWGQEGKERYPRLVERYWSPVPRLEVGQILASVEREFALIDISDGFSQDLGHILDQSGVGVEIDLAALPLSVELKNFCQENGCDPLSFALEGGEDYELIFTAPEEDSYWLCHRIEEKTGVHVQVVGRVTSEHVRKVQQGRKKRKFLPAGWRHFAGGEKKGEWK